MRLQAPEANLVGQPLRAVLILPRGSASGSAGGLIVSAHKRHAVTQSACRQADNCHIPLPHLRADHQQRSKNFATDTLLQRFSGQLRIRRHTWEPLNTKVSEQTNYAR